MSVSREWGLFNDEGMVEGDFWSEAEALEAKERYDEDDDLTAHQVCGAHREHRADECEEDS